MAIKRGVSLYSYQQEQFFKRMTYKDMLREMHDNLHCDGVEIINEATIPGYPFPSDEFIYDWNNTIARYDMHPVALDLFMDVLRFRDHVMNAKEAAELLKIDMLIAKKMGFTHVRGMTAMPVETIERALDTAEKLDIKIAWEIHSPLTIKRTPGLATHMYQGVAGTAVSDTVEFIERTGTKHVGFIVDMGIFTKAPSRVNVEYALRCMDNREIADYAYSLLDKIELTELLGRVEERFPGQLSAAERRQLGYHQDCDVEDLKLIMPYIVSIHGKTYQMTEIPGMPGHYEEKAILYEEVIDLLKKCGWDGYICTEYEGQRSQQDRGTAYLANEIEEVRRHQEMLTRLIGQ